MDKVEYYAGGHEGELEREIHVFREDSLVEIKEAASSVTVWRGGPGQFCIVITNCTCVDAIFVIAKTKQKISSRLMYKWMH